MESPHTTESFRAAEDGAETVYSDSASTLAGGAGEESVTTRSESLRSVERPREDWAISAGVSRMDGRATGTVQSVETAAQAPDAAGAVERISRMMGREAVVFRHSATDSMSVMLRPDANTELMVHLSQRNGQIEASVRCERGDFHQLNALWSQLQEALAHQKVRLAPLQEASDTSQFRNTGGGFSSPGRDDTSRQSRHNSDFMDEWPAPASPPYPAHVRSRRESGHRLSTSRPGWETWA